MLSIGAMGQGQERYYVQLAREDYYRMGGEPPGRYWGKGATHLGLIGQADKDQLTHLFQGYSADGRQMLVRNAGQQNRLIGLDLTASAVKSVSVMWSQADDSIRNEIQSAHRISVDASLSYLEDNAAISRRGRDGIERVSAGLIAVLFEHSCSRSLQPQLHTHALIVNAAVRNDGSTGALDSVPLFKAKMVAGAIYRAELAAQLESQLGLTATRKESWFELDGVPQELVDEFSQRRQAIEARLTAAGQRGAEAAAIAALETRPPKQNVNRLELMEQWRETGRAFGYTADVVRQQIGPRPERDEQQEMAQAIELAVERITERQSHFSRHDLVRAVAEEAQGRGLHANHIRLAAWRYLQSQDVVRLRVVANERRFTTRAMMELERSLLRSVQETQPGATGVERIVVDRVVSTRTLSAEQEAAVRHLTENSDRVCCVRGHAGTGKTYMLQSAADAWRQAGFQVYGACLAAAAAQRLEQGSGIPSQTVHRMLHDINEGRLQLTSRSVAVIDEAALLNTHMTLALVNEVVVKRHAKLVLVGDEQQLQPIEAGGPFKAIANLIGAKNITKIRRQREGWARHAVTDMIQGNAVQALSRYMARGQVYIGPTREDAMRQLVRDWRDATPSELTATASDRQLETGKSLSDHLILCGTRLEAHQLNLLCQAERLKAGELGPRSVLVESHRIYEGDRIMFTRNSMWFKNGNMATVTNIDDTLLTFQLDHGKRMSVDIRDYDHIRLGYSVTTHKSQGATVERAFVLLGGSMQDREISYVQLSRSRNSTRLYTDEATAGPQAQRLARQMSRSRQKDMAHDQLPSLRLEPDWD